MDAFNSSNLGQEEDLQQGFGNFGREPNQEFSLDNLSSPEEIGSLISTEVTGKPLMPAYSGMWGAHGAPSTILDWIPFAKYLKPENREYFNQLSPEDQAKDAIFESAGMLLFFIPIGGRMIEKGLGKVGRRLFMKGRKILPIEDAITGFAKEGIEWEGFSYERELGKRIAKMQIRKGEKDALLRFLQGDQEALREHIVGGLLKEKAEKPSKNFLRSIKVGDETPLPSLRYLSDKKGSAFDLIDKYSPENMQAEFYKKKATKLFAQHGFKYPAYTEGVFNRLAEKVYGREAGKLITLGTATEEQAANIMGQVFRSPKMFKRVASIGETPFPIFHPMRYVMGSMERAFGTMSQIFNPLKQALENTNRFTIEHLGVFGRMLEDRGFGKVSLNKAGVPIFKADKKILTQDVLTEAKTFIDQVDTLMEKARGAKTSEEATLLAREARDSLVGFKEKGGPAARLVDAWYDYSDTLYGGLLERKIPLMLHRMGLKPEAIRALELIHRSFLPEIQEKFSTGAGFTAATKTAVVDKVLGELRRNLILTMFQGSEETAKKNLQKALLSLTRATGKLAGEDKAWPDYLENYVARISKRGVSLDSKTSFALTKNPVASYLRSRELVKSEAPTDFFSMVEGRTRAQGKDLYLHGTISDVAARALGMPDFIRKNTDYLISRTVNRPSGLDQWVANNMSRLPVGDWDAHRVFRASQKVNDMTYMGFLGFKPFSAMRNLFQPLITLPTDLGSPLDLMTAVRGFGKATQKQTRDYLRQIGVITEFVPELSGAKQLPRFGIEGATDSIRDASLWLFKASDTWNRYVSGGAALDKWERAMKAAGGNILSNRRTFFKKLGLRKRAGWVQDEIESLIQKGQVEKAKAFYVKDVVGDTQWLYGGLDAPRIVGQWGGSGRTLTTFQSWWMNYGAAIHKWMMTGEIEGKSDRILTYMMSTALAYTAMSRIWGETRAKRSLGLGPFNVGIQPPVLEPLTNALKGVQYMSSYALGADPKDWEKVERQARATLKTLTNFAPGSLQIKSSFRGYKEQGFQGFLSSILGRKP